MRNIFLAIFYSMISGCMYSPGKIDITKSGVVTKETLLPISISSVNIINHQVVITGTNLTSVTGLKVDGNSLNQNFSIESKSATQIIANSLSAFSFDVSKVFNLVLSSAEASATFQIDFSLCNSTLNGKGFNCAITASDKDVLSYDAATQKWKPRAINGLDYLGAFDASTNPATGPVIKPSGSYYVISGAGNIGAVPYDVGDWLVSNGTVWQKINNSTVILSVYGRTGAITALEGDYNLDKLADVNLSVAPTSGQVLKYNGTSWVAGADNSGGGSLTAGSVGTTELADASVTDAKIVAVASSKITGTIASSQITDGTIVNADVNAAAAIDYSKLNVPAGAIAYAKLTIADGDIPVAKVSGLATSLSSLIEDTIVNAVTGKAPSQNAVYDALALKIGTTGGTLTVGTINGIPTPVNPSDVANKDYVDTQITTVSTSASGKVAKAGDTMSGVLTLDNDLKIKGGSNYVTLKGSATSGAYTLTLPTADGSAGQILKTNGAGVLSWVTDNSGAGAFTGTINKAVITDGAGALSTSATSSTELEYVAGVTSAIQTQINNLLPLGGGVLTGDLTLNTQAKFKGGSNFVTLKANASLASDITLTLPMAVGTNGQMLTTNGSGVMSWTTPATTAAPTGSAGGDLGGSYPNPTISALDAAKIGGGAVSNTEFSYLDGITSSIQTQLTGKQASDATLTALAAFNSNGILVQTAADTFVARADTGTANRIVVTNGDGVSGNPTFNIDTTLFPSPIAGDAGKFLKASGANASAWTALTSADITTSLGFTPVNKAGETISTGTFLFNGAALLRTLDPVGGTDVANKQYVDSYGQWTKSGSDIYRASGNVGVGISTPVQATAGRTYVSVKGSAGAGMLELTQTATDADAVRVGGIQFSDSNSSSTGKLIGFIGTSTSGATANQRGGRLDFATKADNVDGLVERMRIESNGYVGIGTTLPGSALDVKGTIRLSGTTSGYVGLVSPAAGGNYVLALPASAPGTNGSLFVSSTTGDDSWGKDLLLGMVASPVNYVLISGATTTNTPIVAATGSDTNISLSLQAKGTGTVKLDSAYLERSPAYVNSSTAYTIPDSTYNIRRITLTGNATITLPAPPSDTNTVYSLTIKIKQDATGGRTLAWATGDGSTVKWDGASVAAPSTVANAETIYQLMRFQGETIWYAMQVWKE